MYQLKKSLKAKYIWDKGPRPSGYAELTLTLQPHSSHPESVRVPMPSDEILDVYSTDYAKKNPLSVSQRKAFMEMAMKGVIEGSGEALKEFLDQPVANVDVVVEQIKIDLVYSTIMAFRMASKLATEKMLKKGLETGLIVAS